jgi:trehalose 6-phosphate synthase
MPNLPSTLNALHPTLLSARAARPQQPAARRDSRLVAVSNRVADLSSDTQSGGLAVAVGEALQEAGGLWFGWSGETAEDARVAAPSVQDFGAVRTATIPLTPDEHADYYLGFANMCLWPVCHYRVDLARLERRHERAYFAVNERFAQALTPILRPDDRIWVHDYHLIPLGSRLRRRGASHAMGFFLHIPFPPPEMFAAVPRHEELARSLFAYDVVGFQTRRDRENFARYAEEFLAGFRRPGNRLTIPGRTIVAEAYPIGIDAESFSADARRCAASPEARALAQYLHGRKLIVGVDRLDYSKGLPERARGYEALLDAFPVHCGDTTFLQIAPPTREGVEAYDDVRREFEAIAARLNGRYGELDWTPLRYIHRALPRETLAGVMRLSRVGLVTSLRDGMNLVAKEYVAAQDPENPGVLVLSRFAGAAEQMTEALLVNPHSPEGMAAAIHRALNMSLNERRERHAALLAHVTQEDLSWWRKRFLRALGAASDLRTGAPLTAVHVGAVA